MQREVIWRSADGIGAEHLFLTEIDTGIVADSVVFATRDVEPSRTHYRAEMDRAWHIRSIAVSVANACVAERSLELRSDGGGHWREHEDRARPGAIANAYGRWLRFQSSPHPKTGRDFRRSVYRKMR